MDIVATLEGGETKEISLVEELEETLSFSIRGLSESTTLAIEINDAFQENGDGEKPGFWEGLFGGGGDGEITRSNSYNLPVFITKKIIKEEPKLNVTGIELTFVPNALTGNITKSFPFKIFVANSGTEDIENINVSTESDLTLINTEIDLLRPGNQHEITVIAPEDLQLGQILEGTVIAKFGDTTNKSTIILPFNFDVVDETRDVDIKTGTTNTFENCSEIGGTICEGDAKCSIPTTSSSNGACCLGACKEEKKSSIGTIIGFLIIIVILAIVVIFYLKSKKKLKPKSTEQILREKGGKFKERMEGTRSNQVSGGLDRV